LTVKAFDAAPKPAQISDADWKSFTDEEKSVAYAVMGRKAFERKSWAAVQKNYSTARSLNPKNRAQNAEGYYYIGMSLWNQELIDAAMENFARGSKLSGTPHSDPCREQLEKLYRGTHNGSLAGFEEYLGRFGS
jgi:hypothetical protein